MSERADGGNGTRITRRRFAGAAAAGAAGAALPAAASPDRTAAAVRRRRKRADVAVVGAGLAGLAAARRLVAAGRSVVVLEARERPGGRIKNWRCGMGRTCDCGQLVHPDFHRIRALAREFGVELYPPYTDGRDVVYRDGQRTESPASGPGNTRDLLDVVAPDATVAFARLNEMAKGVPPDAPWTAPDAAELDATTVETWADENVKSSRGRSLVELIAVGAMSVEPGDVSLLHLLAYLARAGDPGDPGSTGRIFDFLLKSDLVDGGLQRIPLAIAEELGNRVVYKAAAQRIAQRGKRVEVETPRLTVSARQAILAFPPSVSAQIDYRPPLPPLRHELVSRYPQGTMVTFSAAYERPFWRERGLTGRVGADIEPLVLAVDSSPADAPFGVLTGFALAGRGRRVSRRSEAERRTAAIDNLVTFFGDEARNPKMFLERNWSVPPWTRGCPGFLPPGVLTNHGVAIRQPVGRIHWAGAEYSTSWNTYTEGAVRSGEAVADEVLAAL